MTKLILMRGLPGSGKSHTAHDRYPSAEVIEADQYPGLYDYDADGKVSGFHPELLGKAHADCQQRTINALSQGTDVVVANTFTQKWEADPYRKIASDLGVKLIIDRPLQFNNVETLTDEDINVIHNRNTHGVPLGAYAKMKERWEQFDDEELPA
jgi:predicted kinase